MLRRQSIGQEGASAEFCDLSGRGLSTSQVERTLRVFDTAMAVDMSNNELEQIPATIPKAILALDVSFNLIAHANGIERLQFLQELNLSFNRLADVCLLEFCSMLQRVNLSGNRLSCTRGLDALTQLENLDLSDNLIEYPDALRSLSLNHNLTHLTIRGNPIAHKAATDCRVLVLDMIPSVLILDDKKIRVSAKCRQTETRSSASATTKSLSYSRIYDDKKQFVIHNHHARKPPATRPAPILLGDPTVPTKYEGNSIFIQSPKTTTVTQDLSAPYPPTNQSPRCLSATVSPPPALVLSTPMQLGSSVRIPSPTAPAGAPYMSLYDRLAAANGIVVNRSLPDEVPTGEKQKNESSISKRPGSSHSRRGDAKASGGSGGSQPMGHTRRSMDAGTTRPPSRGGQQSLPQTPATNPSGGYAAVQSISPQHSQAHSLRLSYPMVPPQPRQPQSCSPPPTTTHNLVPASAPSNQHLDPKQQNVLSVIQNLIQHKKQTLATLARQSSSANAASVYSS